MGRAGDTDQLLIPSVTLGIGAPSTLEGRYPAGRSWPTPSAQVDAGRVPLSGGDRAAYCLGDGGELVALDGPVHPTRADPGGGSSRPAKESPACTRSSVSFVRPMMRNPMVATRRAQSR